MKKHIPLLILSAVALALLARGWSGAAKGVNAHFGAGAWDRAKLAFKFQTALKHAGRIAQNTFWTVWPARLVD